MYPEMMVKPMREEVTRLGVTELRSVADVDAALAEADGTALVFVNSVCGCAAGMARPALAKALQHQHKPAKLYSGVRRPGPRCHGARPFVLRRVSAVVAVGRAAQGRRGRRVRASPPDRGPASGPHRGDAHHGIRHLLRVSGHVFHPGHDELHGVTVVITGASGRTYSVAGTNAAPAA